MKEDKEIYGYLFLTDEELSEKINMSVQTIRKYHKQLIEKGYMTIVEIDEKKVKRFKLN